MNPNHYETLGVPRDADANTIKKAYRKKAMQAHPDRGGDAQSMALVNQAGDVLTDPDRRKRYDETGQSDEPPPEHDQAADLLMSAFAEAMNAPEGEFLKRAKAKIETLLRQGQTSIAEVGKAIATMEARRGKTKTDAERNLAQMVIDQRLMSARAEQARITEMMSIARKALTLLEAYRSEEQASGSAFVIPSDGFRAQAFFHP